MTPSVVRQLHDRADAAPQVEESARFTIGEVLARLQPEFPDLRSSKIRFYTDRELVAPERTPAGYRLFSESDIERIRLVLVLQRDHYWPLKRIRRYVSAMDSGDTAVLAELRPRVVSTSGTVPAQPVREVHMRRREFLALTNLTEQQLSELEEFGLITSSASGTFGQQALDIATVAREMAVYGIEPRHLRSFRAAADRESALVDQIVSPLRHQRSATDPQRVREISDALLGLCLRMHAALLGVTPAQTDD